MQFLDKVGLEYLCNKINNKFNNKLDKSTLDEHIVDYELHITDTERIKLSGIESGAQKNTIIGVKGGAESSYRTGNVDITATNIGLGNVDNTSDVNKPVSTAQQLAIDAAIDEAKSGAKEYTDNKFDALLDNSGGAVDSIMELAKAMEDNEDAIDALREISGNKADKSTTLAGYGIADAYTKTNIDSTVSNLEDAINGKADQATTLSGYGITDAASKTHTHNVSDIDDITATVAEINKLDGLTATTTELNYVDGVTSSIQLQLDNKASYDHEHPTLFGTCSTAAGTLAKSVTVDNSFVLESGAKVTVKFDNANTIANPRLNVNNVGSKAIYFNGEPLTYYQHWKAGAVLDFIYDGTQWNIIGTDDVNVTTSITNPSSGDIYFVPFSSAAQTGTLGVNDGYKYYTSQGTASSMGYGRLWLGNSTASGTAGNKRGQIGLYGTNGNYTLYNPYDTSSSQSRYLVGAPTSAGIGDETRPVYVDSTGLIDACSSVAVANGGTGATTAAAARANLGITLENLGFPAYSSLDEGKILRIVDGVPAWVSISNAEEAGF